MKAPERLSNSIALIAFFLAVCGEFVSYKYNSRRDVLYQAQEQQVRDSAAGEVNTPHHEAAANKIADSDQKTLDLPRAQQQWRQETKQQRALLVSEHAGSHSGELRYDLTVAVNDKMDPHAATRS